MKIIDLHKRSDFSPEKEQPVLDFHKNEIERSLNWIKKLTFDFKVDRIYSHINRLKNSIGSANYFPSAIGAYNCLFYASQLEKAKLDYLLSTERRVELQIVDQVFTVDRTYTNIYEGSLDVIQAIEINIILRKSSTLQFLSQVPLSLTEQAPQEDMIYEAMLLFYQVLINETGTKDEALATYIQVEKLLVWDEYKKYVLKDDFNTDHVWQIMFDFRKTYAEHIFLPVLNIYHHILHRDEASYERAVEEALMQWKTYYTMKWIDSNGEERDNSLQPEGYLALPVVAACAFAYNKGLHLKNLQSDYIQAWMIEGNFKNMKPLYQN